MDIMVNVQKIKTLFLSACISIGVVAAAGAEIQEYRGAYAGELFWQGEVTMTGDVLILTGSSLVIGAGTQVNVVPADGTKIDPEYLSSQTELLIRGQLDIQGTAQDPVRFVVVTEESTEEISWAGITLDNAAPSKIYYTAITGADTGIRSVSSSPKIVGNEIFGCRYGIIVQQDSHPQIIDNKLDDGEGGIYVWGDSEPQIRDNRISGQDEEALFVDATSYPKLGYNLISGNTIGLALYPRQLPIGKVETRENKEDLRWLGSQGQGGI